MRVFGTAKKDDSAQNGRNEIKALFAAAYAARATFEHARERIENLERKRIEHSQMSPAVGEEPLAGVRPFGWEQEFTLLRDKSAAVDALSTMRAKVVLGEATGEDVERAEERIYEIDALIRKNEQTIDGIDELLNAARRELLLLEVARDNALRPPWVALERYLEADALAAAEVLRRHYAAEWNARPPHFPVHPEAYARTFIHLPPDVAAVSVELEQEFRR